MADVTKNLFLQIGTKFDAVGTNQALQAFDFIGQKVSDLSNRVKEFTFDSWVNFERSMLAAKKTLDLNTQSFDSLSQSIFLMSARTGTAAEDLAAIAGVAGQLGVQKQNVLGFVEAVNMMSIALDLTGEEAATASAKLLNGFRLEQTQDNVIRLGNVINTLSDTTAASVREIISFMNNFAGTASTWKIPLESAAALGATLVSLGQDASDAGTRISSGFAQILSDDKLDKIAKLLGVSATKLKDMISTDILSSMKLISERMADASVNSAELAAQMNSIFGRVGVKSLQLLAQNWDVVALNILKAKNSSGSMAKEFDNVMKSLGRQLDILINLWTLFGKTIGKVIGGDVGPALMWVNNLLFGFFMELEKSKELQRTFATIAEWIIIAGAAFAAVFNIAIFSTIIKSIAVLFIGLANTIVSAFTFVGGALVSIFGGPVVAIGAVITVAGFLFTFLFDNIDHLAIFIDMMLSSVVNGVKSLFTWIPRAFVEVINFVSSMVIKAVNFWFTSIVGLINKLPKSLLSSLGLTEVLSAVAKPINENTFADFARPLTDEMKAINDFKFKTNIFEGIVDSGRAMKDSIESDISSVMERLSGMATKAKTFKDTFSSKAAKKSAADTKKVFNDFGIDPTKKITPGTSSSKPFSSFDPQNLGGRSGGGIRRSDISIQMATSRELRAIIDGPFESAFEKQRALQELQIREQEKTAKEQLEMREKERREREEKEQAKKNGDDMLKAKLVVDEGMLSQALVDALTLFVSNKMVCGD